MLKKCKNLFMICIGVCFSFTILNAKENDITKTLNFYSKLKFKQKNEHEKKKKYHNLKVKNFNSIKKSENFSSNKFEMPKEIAVQNLDCDLNFIDQEILSKIMSSKFGYNLSLQIQKLLEDLKDVYKICVSDLDVNPSSIIDLKDYNIKSIDDFIASLEQLNIINGYLYFGDVSSAEIEAQKINDLRNLGYELIFNYFIQKKDPKNAERIFSLMIFNQDDEDKFDLTQALIISYLQIKDFESAERLSDSLKIDEWENNKALKNIVKYYARLNDIQNASRIIEKISQDFMKDDAKLYVLDSLARQNNLQEFQKIAFSANDLEFIKKAKFILAVSQNNFKDISEEDFIDFDLIDIVDNFVEILCSTNHVKEAEELINTFNNKIDQEQYELFLINSYLKNGNIAEAKRLRDASKDLDFINKWVASRLISIYENK